MVRWIFFYTHICVQKLDGKSAKYEIPMVYFFDLTCANLSCRSVVSEIEQVRICCGRHPDNQCTALGGKRRAYIQYAGADAKITPSTYIDVNARWCACRCCRGFRGAHVWNVAIFAAHAHVYVDFWLEKKEWRRRLTITILGRHRTCFNFESLELY
jgi:hypothetical protein